MNNNLLIIIVIGISVFFGSILWGYIFARLVIRRRNKKLLKNLMMVLEGKKENFVEIEGVKYHAERFRLRDEKGREMIIDLKGGETQDATEKGSKEERETQEKDRISVREDSRSFGEDSRRARRFRGFRRR